MRRFISSWNRTLSRLGLKWKKKHGRKEPPKCTLATERLEGRDMFAVSIDAMHLLNDTGLYATDLVTSDPTIGATANGTFSGSVEVEFDHNNDGAADGQATVDMPGDNFSYDPRTSDASFQTLTGPVSLKYRTLEQDVANNTTITGSWNTFSFTMQPPSNAEVDVVDEWFVNVPDNIGSVSAGNTQVGTPVSLSFTIYNLGSDDLLLNPDSLALPSGFSLVTPFASTVEPDEQTTLTVQLDATSAGNYSGALSFRTSDADESPFNFTLSGEVFSDQPEIEVRLQSGENIANESGSVDFGTTTDGAAVERTFTISNWGSGTLTLAAASLSLPSGFSLVSGFAASVGPQGGQTSFTVKLDASAVGTYSGSLSFTTNDADENPFDFALSGVVDDGSGSPISVADVHLVDDTGALATDRVTYDPTVTGYVNGDFEGGTVEIEFDHDADETVDGSVIVAATGAAFTYDPRVAESALASFNGTLPLAYRAAWHSADSQTTTTGAWLDFPIELMVDPSVAGLSIREFGLESDTGASNSDRITVRPTLLGVVTGDFGGGSVRVEFDHDDDGVAQGSVIVAATGDEFLYDPRTVAPALATFVGSLTIGHRLVKLDAASVVVATGPWSQYGFTLAAPESSARVIENLRLLNDTGVSDSDGVTFDATIKGTVSSGAAAFKIEFDLNGDNTVDAQVSANADRTFQFQPSGLSYGAHAVRARVREWDEGYLGFVAGAWQTLSFTLVAQPAVAIDSLALKTDTGASSTDKLTSDPTLAGKLVGALGTSSAPSVNTAAPNVAGIKIQFDHNGDGAVDGHSFTDASGHFTYRPTGLGAGEVTIRARSTRWDQLESALVVSAWQPFVFTYAPVPLPTVSELKLNSDTGESSTDNITQDATLTGTLAGVNLEFVYVEFDHDGDGDADGETTSDSEGNFAYVPYGLSPGQKTVRARSSRWDDDTAGYVRGPWASFSFTLEAAAQTLVDVSSFGLARDDGVSSTDLITTVPTLKGQLSGGRSVAYVALQFDHDGNGTVDGSTTTDYAGNFFYDPQGLGLGEQTVSLRAREWDYSQQQGVNGAWSPFTFTLVAKVNAPPAVTEFHVQSDTGALYNDNLTANALLAGKLTNDGSPARLTVEFDHNDDGTVEGTAASDEDGNFRYRPEPLSYGAVTIAARAVEWNEVSGAYQRSPWVNVTFTYEDQPNAAPVMVSLAVAPPPANYYEPQPVSLEGRVLNEGDLGQIVVEFDYNADGAFDRVALTDELGKFTFTPEGLAYGQATIQVRTRELDEVTHQLLYGAWTSFSFDNVEPINQPAVITLLALAHDTGTAGDSISTDATVSGQITNDGLLSGLTVEFDHNNDGTADGFATTGDTGQFTYQPAGLAAGAHTLRARTKEYTAAGAAVLGAWQTISFTLETPPDPTLRVTQLSLVEDSGLSATDGATANPAITGTVSGSSVGGVTVQIDVNGDGISDGTATTDASGHFTYTPTNLPTGRITLRAHVDGETAGSTGLVPWESHTFVHSPAPDGAEAQSLVDAFSDFDEDWQNAQVDYDADLATANDVYRGAYNTAVSAYEATLSSAGALRESAVSAARTVFHSAKAVANTAYAAAVAAAGSAFAQNISEFSGNATSYSLPEFQWPDAPPDSALAIPSDEEQPAPPAAGPNYDFEPYDYQATPYHQQDSVAQEQLYSKHQREANDVFAAAKKTAEAAYSTADAQIRDAFNQAKATIAAAYHTALEAGVPPVDMDAEYLSMSAASQLAHEKFDRDLRRAADDYSSRMNSAYLVQFSTSLVVEASYYAQLTAEYASFATECLNNPNPNYGGHYSRLAVIEHGRASGHANGQYAYQETMAGAAELRASREADARLSLDEKLAALQETVDQKQAQLDHWQAERRINAEQVRTKDLADAALVRDKDLAERVRVRDNFIADAAKVRHVKLAEARIDYRQALAAERRATLGAYAFFEDTPAAEYQAQLADHQVAYLASLRPKFLLHEQATAEATLAETKSLNQAEKDQADGLAQADRNRVVVRSAALRTIQLASNNAELARNVANVTLWKVHVVGLATADHFYAGESGQAQYEYALASADAWRDQSIAYAQIEVDYPGPETSSSETAAYEELQDAYRDRFAVIDHAATYGQYAAQEHWDEARSLAARQHQQWYHGEEQIALDKVTDAWYTYEVALAGVNRDRSVKVVQALGKFDLDAAAADVAWWQAVAPADETLDNFQAGFEKTADDADAASWKTFLVDTAADFADGIAIWSVLKNTPWALYQSKLANAEETRVIDQSTADVAEAQALSQAQVARTAAVGASNKDYYLAEAAAYKARVETVVGAFNGYAVAVGAGRVGQATSVADATGVYDKGVVAKNLVYQNKIATEQEKLRNALDDARWTYYRAAADAQMLLTQEEISDTEYSSLLNAAYTIELEAQAAAEIGRANTLAAARATWIHDTGLLNAGLAGLAIAKANAADTLAGVVKTQTVDLAGKRATAAKTLSAAVAEQIRDNTVDYAQADAAYSLAASQAGADYAVDSDKAASIERKSRALARADYELALVTAHANKLAAVPSVETTPLSAYELGVAQADVARATSYRASLVLYQDGLAGSSAAHVLRMNAARYTRALEYSGASGIDVAYAMDLSDAEKGSTIAYDEALADLVKNGRGALAVRAESNVKGESSYQKSLAQSRATLNDDLAAVSVVWVGQMATAKGARHTSQDYENAQALYDAAQLAADIARGAGFRAKGGLHAGRVGDAQIVRAGSLGGALVVETSSLGAAGIDYTSRLISADLAYEPKITLASNTRLADSATADNAFADESAGAQDEAADAYAGASYAHQGRLGLADVTRAGSLAVAEGTYQYALASQTSSRMANWSAAAGTAYAAFQAADAAARAAWTQLVTPAFVGFRTASTQTDVDHDARLWAAANQGADLSAADGTSYGHDARALAATNWQNAHARGRTFIEGQVGRDGTQASSFTLADSLRSNSHALAARQHAVDLATAEKTYQVAYAAVAPGADTTQIAKARWDARANADLARTTSLADADKDWAGRLAEANSLLMTAQAGAAQGLQADLAALDKSLAVALAERQAALYNALAAVDTIISGLQTVAGNLWESGMSLATANVWSSESSGKSTALESFASALATPWANYQSALGSTVSSWWTGAKDAYLAWTTDTNTVSATHDGAISTARTTRVSQAAAAHVTYVSAAVTAEEALANSATAAQKAYLLALVGPTETRVKAVALAERNHRVALATAERNLAVGQVEGQTYDAASRSAAEAAAHAARDTALKTAATTYAIAEAVARGIRFTAGASAQLTYAVTVGATAVAETLTTGSADKAFVLAESAAGKLWTTAVAAIDTAKTSSLGQGFASALSSFSAGNGTPWAGFDSAKASASATQETALLTAGQTLETAIAVADDIKTGSLANAAEALFNTLAGAAKDWGQGVATAFSTLKSSEAQARNGLAAAGLYGAELPADPTRGSGALPTIAPAAVEDFFGSGGYAVDLYWGHDDFDRYPSEMFTSAASDWNYWWGTASPQYGDRLTERMSRGEVPETGADVRTQAEKDGATWESFTSTASTAGSYVSSLAASAGSYLWDLAASTWDAFGHFFSSPKNEPASKPGGISLLTLVSNASIFGYTRDNGELYSHIVEFVSERVGVPRTYFIAAPADPIWLQGSSNYKQRFIDALKKSKDASNEVFQALVESIDKAKMPGGTGNENAWQIHHIYQQDPKIAEWLYNNKRRLKVHDVSNLVAVPAPIHDLITAEQTAFWDKWKKEYRVTNLDKLFEILNKKENAKVSRQVLKEYEALVARQKITYSKYWISADSSLAKMVKALQNIDKIGKLNKSGKVIDALQVDPARMDSFRLAFLDDAGGLKIGTKRILATLGIAVALGLDNIDRLLVLKGVALPNALQQAALDEMTDRYRDILREKARGGVVKQNMASHFREKLIAWMVATNQDDELIGAIGFKLQTWEAGLGFGD